jgi:hypothetical protein
MLSSISVFSFHWPVKFLTDYFAWLAREMRSYFTGQNFSFCSYRLSPSLCIPKYRASHPAFSSISPLCSNGG